MATRKKRGQVYRKTGGCCAYCGRDLDPFENWHVEHMTAKVNGGTNDIENLVPSCHSCNMRKRSKSFGEYKDWILGGPAAQFRKIANKLDFAESMVDEDKLEELRNDIETLATKLEETPVTFYIDTLVD